MSKIKSEKIAFNPSPFSSYNFADFDPTEDHILTIVELNQNKPTVNKYVLKGAKSTLRKLNSTSRKVRTKYFCMEFLVDLKMDLRLKVKS